MKIYLKEISIGDVTNGYVDNSEDGVTGYGGLLDIRPKYQREFCYDAKKRNAVIDTIMKGFPLNVMYWCKNADGTYELLDGQQRTVSFCQYVNGEYSVADKDGNTKYFFNLTEQEQHNFLSYKLFVYICEGGDKERLDWFKTINIAGEKLTDQELLNVNYTGTWLSSAKQRFSKTNCVAYRIGSKYVKGTPIRQEYLETALDWISDGSIPNYMAEHQFDENADELYNNFKNVIEWIETVFPNYRKEMLGIEWGRLYKEYHGIPYDCNTLESLVKELMENEEVTDKKGIYEYVLSGCDEYIARRLSKRSFSMKDKREAYEKQNGICTKCGKHYKFEEMVGDHINPWWLGGKTVLENLQMLCSKCNGVKGGKSNN